MSDDWQRAIEIEVSKLTYLLENLYAVSFRDHGATPDDVDAMSDEMCRQALLPATSYGSDPRQEELHQFQELLSHRLAMFFARVRDRVAQD